jgi:putative flippase GtrA
VYSVIGASGATLDFLAFLVLYNVLQVNPFISTVISVSLGIINNFIWNVLFNFKVRDHLLRRFVSFYAVGGFGILLSAVIIYILHDLLHMNANLAKLLSIPIIVVVQYGLNKTYSFGNKTSKITGES